jgi:hypothetical protein
MIGSIIGVLVLIVLFKIFLWVDRNEREKMAIEMMKAESLLDERKRILDK